MSDCNIIHPPHYGGEENPYECIKVLEAWLSPDEFKGFLRGNIIKYICRCESKDNKIEDLQKADCYLHFLISYEQHSSQ